jgi:hypothetical protein
MSEEGTSHVDEELEGDREGYELDDGIVDTENGMFDSRSVQKRMSQHINMLRDFADGLQYQLQFNDRQMLDSLEREGATFMRFAQTCLDRERHTNLTRGSSPITWEQETASAMFYQMRPPHRDNNT